MSDTKQPNIVFFFWDNFGWGELGCYGGGVLRGAPTPRIDAFAAEGLKLLNFNMEAQCTPSPIGALDRSAPDPLGHGGGGARRWPRRDDTLGGDDRPGAVRCRVRDGDVGQVAPGQRPRDTGARSTSASTRPSGRPRTADEVLWTMQSYFPNGDVTSRPYAGDDEDHGRAADDLLEEEGREARGGQRLRRGVAGGVRSQDHRVGDRLHAAVEGRGQAVLRATCPTRRCTTRRSPTRSTPARRSAGTWPTSSPRWTTSPA